MKALKVLLIEDDKIEVLKFQRTLRQLELNYSVKVSNNGQEALDFLKNGSDLPDLILLDLNMPKINGKEFLSRLKKDESINHIPVIILTTSKNKNDLKECYRLGIGGYMLKPLKYEDYVQKIEKLFSYWTMIELKV